jgi:hypothetical protein
VKALAGEDERNTSPYGTEKEGRKERETREKGKISNLEVTLR